MKQLIQFKDGYVVVAKKVGKLFYDEQGFELKMDDCVLQEEVALNA